MADFCWDCTRDVMGVEPEKNDLMGIAEEGQVLLTICEGCGPGQFDHDGRRVDDEEER